MTNVAQPMMQPALETPATRSARVNEIGAKDLAPGRHAQREFLMWGGNTPWQVLELGPVAVARDQWPAEARRWRDQWEASCRQYNNRLAILRRGWQVSVSIQPTARRTLDAALIVIYAALRGTFPTWCYRVRCTRDEALAAMRRDCQCEGVSAASEPNKRLYE